MSQTVEAVLEDVVTCVADALELDREEVDPDASLIEELGAESVDLLDIVFRIERRFSIRIPRRGIEKAAKQEASTWTRAGVLTEQALDVLRERMPEVPPDRFAPGLKPKDIPRLFSTRTFARLASEHLADAPSRPRRRTARGRASSA